MRIPLFAYEVLHAYYDRISIMPGESLEKIKLLFGRMLIFWNVWCAEDKPSALAFEEVWYRTVPSLRKLYFSALTSYRGGRVLSHPAMLRVEDGDMVVDASVEHPR